VSLRHSRELFSIWVLMVAIWEHPQKHPYGNILRNGDLPAKEAGHEILTASFAHSDIIKTEALILWFGPFVHSKQWNRQYGRDSHANATNQQDVLQVSIAEQMGKEAQHVHGKEEAEVHGTHQ